MAVSEDVAIVRIARMKPGDRVSGATVNARVHAVREEKIDEVAVEARCGGGGWWGGREEAFGGGQDLPFQDFKVFNEPVSSQNLKTHKQSSYGFPSLLSQTIFHFFRGGQRDSEIEWTI